MYNVQSNKGFGWTGFSLFASAAPQDFPAAQPLRNSSEQLYKVIEKSFNPASLVQIIPISMKMPRI